MRVSLRRVRSVFFLERPFDHLVGLVEGDLRHNGFDPLLFQDRLEAFSQNLATTTIGRILAVHHSVHHPQLQIQWLPRTALASGISQSFQVKGLGNILLITVLPFFDARWRYITLESMKDLRHA